MHFNAAKPIDIVHCLQWVGGGEEIWDDGGMDWNGKYDG